MKLNNYLINTLPDFAKHFTFVEFMEKRGQFVRDMHPNKVYYWNDTVKKAYYDVVAWINEGDAATEAVTNTGISALEMLIGRKLGRSEMNGSGGETQLSDAIIRVKAGTVLNLPQYVPGANKKEISLRYHKIEVYGHSDKPALIKIGDKLYMELYASDFVYVTESENHFIEFLPKHLYNDVYVLNLVSAEGDFASVLNVTARLSGRTVSYENVISFALTDDGYIFIDSNGKPIILSSSLLAMKLLLRHDGAAFYVKAEGNVALILYKDGTLKATVGNGALTGIVGAYINDTRNVEVCKS
mgnify:CR=1 FL=1